MNFTEELTQLSSQVDQYLANYFEERAQEISETNLLKSMQYSVLAGGKRIRPVLTLAVVKMLSEQTEKIMPLAAAIEMIHTYSLIHDDLPAMDDDDYRRGKLTNHMVYGEALAILAGDGLLNEACELMLKTCLQAGDDIKQATEAAIVVSQAAGITGMIAGQVIDMEAEGEEITSDTLTNMHRKKTGALLRASVVAPAVYVGAPYHTIQALSQYAEAIGIAFQIKDDILDVESSIEELGKPVGSDAKNNKTTYVSLFGLSEAKKMLQDAVDNALSALTVFGDRAWFLRETACYIAYRSH